MADEAPAVPIGDRPVVCVDIRHDVARNEGFEISGRHRTRVHRSVVQGLGVGQHDDQLARAACERALDGLGYVDLLRPLFRADGITMKRIHDRIAPVALARIARRQDDQDGAIDGVALEIALECLATNGDALNDGGTCAGDDIGDGSLDLTGSDLACTEPDPSTIAATRYTSSFIVSPAWSGRASLMAAIILQLMSARAAQSYRRVSFFAVAWKRFQCYCPRPLERTPWGRNAAGTEPGT